MKKEYSNLFQDIVDYRGMDEEEKQTLARRKKSTGKKEIIEDAGGHTEIM